MLFDDAVVETVVDILPLWLAVLLLFLSYLSSVYVVGPAVAFVYWFGDGWRPTTWPGIVLGAYGLFVAVKPIFSIDRPPVDPPFPVEVLPSFLRPLYGLAIHFDTGSFPSGHAVIATVFWGLVVLDLDVGTVGQRILASICAITIVGLARVGLSVHYVGDVVGGVVVGLVYLGLMVALREHSSAPVAATLGASFLVALGGVLAGQPVEAGIVLGTIAIVFLIEQTGITSRRYVRTR